MFLNRKYNTDGLQSPQGEVSLNFDSPHAQGLVGWWPRGSDPTGTLKDHGVRKYDLTVVGATRVATHFGDAKALMVIARSILPRKSLL